MNGTLQGKVALVTGATSGIGKETATGLARMGATVVIVGRNIERGQAAVQDIIARSNNSDVELIAADMTSQQSVRDLVRTFQERHGQLHILVNNIGGSYAKRTLTVDGIETSFALNYLNPFLLTNLLVPVLRASAPSRIVNVSSRSHRLFGPLNFDDLQAEKSFLGMRAYGQAKVALLLFTYELARRLEGTGIIVNAVDPGNASTEGSRSLTADQLPWYLKLMSPLLGVTQKLAERYATAEKAAQGSIYAATSPDIAHTTGQHFNAAMKMTPSAKFTYDEAAGKHLWEVSLSLLKEPLPALPPIEQPVPLQFA